MKSTSESPRREEQSPSPKPLPLPVPAPRRPGPPLVVRWILWGLVIAALVGGAVWYFKPKPKDPAAAFETTAVQRRSVEARVTATGTVSALVTVQVGSQVSGRLQEILVDYNSPVKKGQVIARIDPQLLQAALDRAKANLLAAKAAVQKSRVESNNSRLQADRAKTLRQQQFIAQADLDTAEATAQSAATQVTSAEAALAQAQAAVNEADVNLHYATIVSPTDGIVISRSVDVGQTVAASLQAPVLFIIAEDLRKMQVDTSVAESDVGRLTDGMSASFSVDAWPGETFQGVIRQIRNASQTIQNVVTYDAVIDVQNPQLRLKPGMTANVTFITAHAENVLTVPNVALRFRPPANLLGEGKHRGQGHGGGAWAGKGAEGAAGAGAAAGGEGNKGEGNKGEGGKGEASATPAATAPAGAAGGEEGSGSEEHRHARAPGSKVVFVLREGKPTPVRVKPGVSDGTNTQVEGELNEGELVITAMNTEGQPSAPSNNANVKIPGMGGGGGGRNGGGGRPPGPF